MKRNSCPWYSFVVLSIQNARFHHANSWLPDAEQTHAEKKRNLHGPNPDPDPAPPPSSRKSKTPWKPEERDRGAKCSPRSTTRYPDLKKQIYNDEGKLRSFVNVYLNDDDIRYLNKDATPVAATDTLSIVPSIAGGARGI